MLPSKNRLIKGKNFEATHRYGSLFSFGNISLKAKKSEKVETRIGFSVSIKNFPKAFQRNRIKRQLREIARKNLKKIKGNYDIVVMVRKNSQEQPDFLEKNFLKALEKGKLIIN